MPDQNGYEAYRSLVFETRERDAQGETTLLIKVMKFSFGDVDAMGTKFEEFNLLIKEHDDISGIDNTPDTIKRAILVARAPESLRTHLQLNSQSYSTFLEMRQAINQYLKARKGFKLRERDDSMDFRSQRKPERKRERKRQGQRKVQRPRQVTSGANVWRKGVEPRNKRTMSVRRR